MIKYAALGIKLLILNFPAADVLDVNFAWRCTVPALCPQTCTSQDSGSCIATNADTCLCLHYDFWLGGLLSCGFQIGLSFLSAVMSYRKYLNLTRFIAEAPRPRATLVGQLVLTVVPLVTQSLYLILTYEGSACTRQQDVALLILPGLLVSLMANEAKRLLRSWNPEVAGRLGIVASNSFFVGLRIPTVAATCLAAGLCLWGAVDASPVSPGCTLGPQVWLVCGCMYLAAAVATLAMLPVGSSAEQRQLDMLS